MNNTEAPFVVSHNFCAVRADTPEELLAKLNAFNANPDIQQAIAHFRDTVTNSPSRPSAAQPATLTAVPTMALAPDVAAAVNNIQAAGMTGQVAPAGIEQRVGKYHMKPNPEVYERGHAEAGVCSCGGRILKDWTTKAGDAKKAYVCLSDSPFGTYKADKCAIVWAN
jgi:hypothetical protein